MGIPAETVSGPSKVRGRQSENERKKTKNGCACFFRTPFSYCGTWHTPDVDCCVMGPCITIGTQGQAPYVQSVPQ